MVYQQLYLPLGGDLSLNGNGGLQVAGSFDAIVQNLSRYIFTNASSVLTNGQPLPADWIFYPKFGLSANALVGQNFTSPKFINAIQQAVYQGALNASTGNSSAPPVVTVSQGPTPNQINVNVVIYPNNGNQISFNVILP